VADQNSLKSNSNRTVYKPTLAMILTCSIQNVSVKRDQNLALYIRSQFLAEGYYLSFFKEKASYFALNVYLISELINKIKVFNFHFVKGTYPTSTYMLRAEHFHMNE
jgi:hypothetical protein